MKRSVFAECPAVSSLLSRLRRGARLEPLSYQLPKLYKVGPPPRPRLPPLPLGAGDFIADEGRLPAAFDRARACAEGEESKWREAGYDPRNHIPWTYQHRLNSSRFVYAQHEAETG